MTRFYNDRTDFLDEMIEGDGRVSLVNDDGMTFVFDDGFDVVRSRMPHLDRAEC